MFDFNCFKRADKKKLHVLASAMGIDDSAFKTNNDFIKAFKARPKIRLNHDKIAKLFVLHLNKQSCITGPGSANKMISIIIDWVIGGEEGGQGDDQEQGKCLLYV